jgi:CRISPR/Cas system-associated exonuclease Cas4 (RecB family)
MKVAHGRDYTPAGLENLCYTRAVPIIRSSDIGTYLYCRRAWWYRRQGVEPANQAELAAGTELHRRHGRQVLASSITRIIGLVLLMVALVMLVAYCTAQII